MSRNKKMIYIAHPVGNHGDFDKNIAETNKILLELCMSEKYEDKYIFVTPITMYADMYYKVTYDKGMDICLNLLSKCDEIWVFGEYDRSTGCLLELEYAKKHDIPVVLETDNFV